MGLLRILLAISIIFVHAGKPFGFEMISSKIAIQSFYIISGFYMALILSEKYNLKKNAYRIFITNRVLRIYPIYWMVLILTVVTALWTCTSTVQVCLFFPSDNQWLYVLKNIFIFPSLEYFSVSAFSKENFIVPVAWTLGLEMLFYVIAPFLVKRNVKFLLFIAAASLLVRTLVMQYNATQDGPYLYFNVWFFPSQLVFFVLGVLSYKLYQKVKKMKVSEQAYRFITGFMIGFTLLFTTIIGAVTSLAGEIGYLYYVCIVLCIPFIFNYTKKSLVNNVLGEISYTVYLAHSLIVLLLPLSLLPVSKDIYPLIIVAVTCVFALIVRRFVEFPINKYRQGIVKHK